MEKSPGGPLNKESHTQFSLNFWTIIIDHVAGEKICLVVSICPSVRPFVCWSSPEHLYHYMGVQIGCAFNSVVFATGWAFAVDHAFNCLNIHFYNTVLVFLV